MAGPVQVDSTIDLDQCMGAPLPYIYGFESVLRLRYLPMPPFAPAH